MLKRLFGRAESPSTRDVEVRDVPTLQEQGAHLIDVREPDEFAAGHARGAHNIPIADR